MYKSWLICLVIFMVAAGFAGAAEKGALDGKSFVGETGEKGKVKGDKDELIFADGKFRSTGCDQYGFTAVPYATKKEGGSISFEAHSTSEKEGTIHWTGKVTGDDCEGTFVWSKPGQKDIEYWFKGALEKASN